MGLIETAVTQFHRWVQRSANATTPASGYWNLFFKAGGLYTINSAGAVVAHGGGAITTLTIATGAITITGKHHFVDTEASAASDDLDTINGGYEGQELFIQALAGARTVVIRHGVDNIRTYSGQNITLDETYKFAHLVFDDSFWNAIAYPLSAIVGTTDTQTLTNKTISRSANTVTMGAYATKTLSSDVAAIGVDRHLRISAESGVVDDFSQITTSPTATVGELIYVYATNGHTITIKHGLNNIYMRSGADYVLPVSLPTVFIYNDSGNWMQVNG